MLKATRSEGLFYWGRPQLDRGIDFNGWLWRLPAGNVLLDPMPLDAGERARLLELGGARWILVTSLEHLRAAPALASELGAELWLPTGDRARLEEAGVSAAGWYEGEADLPAPLRDAVRVLPLPGGKSPVEPAFELLPARAVYFGDLVRSHESGRLRLLPEDKLADPAAARRAVAGLGDLDVDAVLLGDGDPILFRGGEALRELARELA